MGYIVIIFWLIVALTTFSNGKESMSRHYKDSTSTKEQSPLSQQDRRLHDDIAEILMKVLERLDKMEQQQFDVIERQSDLSLAFKQQSERLNHIENQVYGHVTSNANAVYSIFGCRMDIIAISCDSGKTITISSAHFGQYANRACADTCCGPHPTDDCTESLQEEGPIYWDVLTQACNNQTSCDFEVPTATVDSCQDPYTAEYLSIKYTCNPQTTEKGIGFTATASTTRSYDIGDVVIFDHVISNIGKHYDSQTSIFTCPTTGTFMFSTALRKTPEIIVIHAHIMHEGQSLTSTAVVGPSEADQGGATANLRCNTGNRVWIEVDFGAINVYGNPDYGFSYFTGCLIQSY